MHNNRIVRFVGLVSLLIAGGWWLLSEPDNSGALTVNQQLLPPSQSVPPSQTVLAQNNTIAKEIAPGSVVNSSYKLPPKKTQLSFVLDELLAQASAGNARAACRLGVELTRCNSEMPETQRRIAQIKDELDVSNNPIREQQRYQLEVLEQSMETLHVVCEGFVNVKKLEGWRFKLQAAQSGHIPFMVDYASFPSDELLTAPKDSPAVKAFVEPREGFLVRGAAVGNSTAILGLLEEYAGASSFAVDPVRHLVTIRPDAAKVALYAYLYMLLPPSQQNNMSFVQKHFKKAARQLSPQQLGEMKRQADTMAEAWPPSPRGRNHSESESPEDRCNE